MDIVLFSIYLTTISIVVRKASFFKVEGLKTFVFPALFYIKLFAGVALMLLYKYYYDTQTSDIFNYFNDGYAIHNLAKINFKEFLKVISGIGDYSEQTNLYLHNNTDFWFKNFNYGLINDNRIVIRLNAVLHFISLNNIGTHILFFSFLSFLGSVFLYKVFCMFSCKKYLYLIPAFLIPSELLWSSSLLKEAILMFGLGLLVYSFVKIIYKRITLKLLLSLTLSVFILIFLKIYVLLALLPGAILLLINKRLRIKPEYSLLIILTIFTSFTFLSGKVSNYDIPQIISQKQHDFINMLDASERTGSRIKINELQPNLFSFAKNTPVAIFNVIFRPTPFDIHSLIVLPAVAENVIISLGLILMFVFFDKKTYKKHREFYLFSISFVIILSVLIGLTTPVLGAIVRYKIPFLPFLVFIIVSLNNTKNETKLQI